jgi:hypothetical protein
MLALLTRSLWQRKPEAARYIHRTRRGASSGLYLPVKNMHRSSGSCQSGGESSVVVRNRDEFTFAGGHALLLRVSAFAFHSLATCEFGR